ncbi:MAG: hypothetical protein AB2708_21225 [Candidatus Thiodiazotropha taylori]
MLHWHRTLDAPLAKARCGGALGNSASGRPQLKALCNSASMRSQTRQVLANSASG